MGANPTATLVATVAAAGIVQLPTAAIVVALTRIHAEFGTSIAELQWTVTAFMIPFSALLIAAGRVADIFGRRRLLLIGSALFALGSLIAAASPDIVLLIVGIALAGTGGALLMPSSMAILTDLFTGSRRGFAIGMWGAATELVSGIGVLVGGVLTGALDWRWIFVVCIAFAGLIAVLAIRGVRESSDPTVTRQVDGAGVAFSVTALTALTLALTEGSAWGWGSPAIVGLLAGAVVLAVAFVLTERRASNPLVDFSFFRRRNFAGATVVIFVLDFSFGALLFFLPLYFAEILDYSPTQIGVLLLPLTGLMVVGSPLGGRIAARVGPRPPIVTGLAAMAVAIYLISTLSLETTYADLWLPSALMGFGVGIALTPMNLAAMNAIAREHAGAASGLLVTLSGLGATLGVAVTGAIFNELMTERTVTRAGEVGVETTRAQAQQLDGVLAGAADAQRTLASIAGDRAAAVRAAVREAFVDALGTSLKLSAALIVVGLLLTVALMRDTPQVGVEVAAAEADASVEDEPIAMLGTAVPRPVPRFGSAG
jgi:EmrB/QacA subfamily drug resistance transporter